MKIVKIENIDFRIYKVTIRPSFIEKILGKKEETIRIKDTDRSYIHGNGSVYINERGEYLGNGNFIGEAIDNWRRRF